MSILAIGLVGCSGSASSPQTAGPTSADTSAASDVETPAADATPMIVKDSAGHCGAAEASWAADDGGIAVTTLVSGPVTVQVNIPGENSVTANATIGALDVPYVVDVPNVDASKIHDVQLFSIATEDRPASYCTVPKG